MLPLYPKIPESGRELQRALSTIIRDHAQAINSNVTQDDVIIDLATRGLVLKDTQATPHYWRVTISTLGALVTTDLGTDIP